MSPAGGDSPPGLVLDGSSLTIEELARVARDPRLRVRCSAAALARVTEGREQIERLTRQYQDDFARLQRGEAARPVFEYGVTTGFGEFKNIPVAPGDLELLQRNILLSHAAGAGASADPDNPASYYDPDVVRAVLVIRLNAFLKGHSGVRPALVRTLEAMINRGLVPRVPIHGSVGSSGDLCPLAHLFVVLVGEGCWSVVQAPEEVLTVGPRPRPLRRGLEALAEDLGMEPSGVSYKEGLSLTNGTTFSTALLALAVHDGDAAARAADTAAALSLEAVCGCARAFDPRVHLARGHAGQIASAAAVRELIEGSRLIEKAGAVQDVYSLRCAPAVHGAVRDTLGHVRRVAELELNAATDNPLFFPADSTPPWDCAFRDNWPEGFRGDLRAGYSAGNFHGEPIGMAADFLAIAVAELASIAERRIQMLLDARQSRNLPANLIPCRGINSGYMLAQYTAASIVSENKVLTHPASVDSIPTSANSEDHNAMSTIAARKLRAVLRNVQAVLAIELLVAAQAVDWRVAMAIDPRSLRERESGPSILDAKPDWESAEREGRDFAAGVAADRRESLAAPLGAGTRRAYRLVRSLAPPMLADRTLDEDIRAVRAAVEAGRF